MTKYSFETLDELLGGGFIFAVFSNVKKGAERTFNKIDVKPVLIKGTVYFQVSRYFDQKVFHENLSKTEAMNVLHELMGTYFKQAQFFTTQADVQVLFNKKGDGTVLKKAPSRFEVSLTHDRKKEYIIPEGEACDFMEALGVMDADGRVYKKKYDKFRQLNKYLEFVEDSMGSFEDEMTIIDFGCGKAYLTFALYYYLVKLKGKKAQIIGLDLKRDVIEFCNETAQKLGYESLIFKIGDISDFDYNGKVDMVVSLHACDTATDEAIFKAVTWGAKVIFAVPCCQHELFAQLKNDQMTPLLKHGVIRDKLATIVTDTLRANALEAVGYTVQMLEFIDMEHTPKNILIRAIKTEKSPIKLIEDYSRYLDFKAAWQVKPRIDNVLKAHFPKLPN